jgi:hypothetical protein
VVKLNLHLTNGQKNLIKKVITRVPRNEEEVKRIFYKLEGPLSFQDVKVFDLFPDASAFYNGKEIFIEFEYCSSNFKRHEHEEKDCDLIVCWEDDDSSIKIHVLELSTLAENWLKKRAELMGKYISLLQEEKCGALKKDVSRGRARIESLMEEYNFDHNEAVAKSMGMTKSGLLYYDKWADPECVGGPLECEKRDIEPKYLGIKTSLKLVPVVLCKNCQNKVKCRWGCEQRIGYYILLRSKSDTPRKVYFERYQIENEEIVSHTKLPRINLWKGVQFRRR